MKSFPIFAFVFLAMFATSNEGNPIPEAVADQRDVLAIEIQGGSPVREGVPKKLVAFLPDRPLREDANGYSPVVMGEDGNPLPAFWEPPVSLLWNFGDGTEPIFTGEHLSVAHRFPDQGTYTVTVRALVDGQVYAEGTHELTVTNRGPEEDNMGAVEIDPETSTVEFTASAHDVPDDPLIYQWDFGDGNTEEGVDLWTVQHRYRDPGEYTATVTFIDQDGDENSEEHKVRVSGAGGSGSSTPDLTGDDDVGETDVTVDGFAGTFSGALNGQIDAEIRSFRGLFLTRINTGVCRFTFSAWDDENLVHMMSVIDLNGLPPEGARFQISRPNIALIFEPDANTYSATKRSWFGRMGSGGLGSIVDGIASILNPAQRQAIADSVGVDPQAREGRAPRAMPERSPFGLEERVTFAAESGSFQLTFIPGSKAFGTIDIAMKPSGEDGPTGNARLHLQTSMSLDLNAARRDGLVRYDGCEPADLEIASIRPKEGTEHDFLSKQRPVRVRFSRSYNPVTLTHETFQLAYTDASGELIPINTRILRDERVAWLVPTEPMWPGVKYTVRIKAGAEGVKTFGGGTLADSEETGWRTSHFTPRLEFAPTAAYSSHLACHLVQTSRDMPLIAGKPAVARVYAEWPKLGSVHPDMQTDAFEARVILTDNGGNTIASVMHEFVRPDLWAARGIKKARAEHTAQVFGFTPSREHTLPYRIRMEVKETPDAIWKPRYYAACPSKIWDQEPSLSIDFLVLPFAEWAEFPDRMQAMMPTLQAIADDAEEYMWQIFPVANIEGRNVRAITFPEDMRLPPSDQCGANCFMNGSDWWPGLDSWLKEQSSADLVIGFIPHGRMTGGSTGSRLYEGQGAAVIIASDTTEYLNRYVSGLVHEVGHILEREHLPYIWTEGDQTRVSEARSNGVPLQYRGIEGMRMKRDGSAAWNKSSSEGNEESDWLAPLMYPATIATERAFIANHHYRALQCLFERRAGDLSEACQVTR